MICKWEWPFGEKTQKPLVYLKSNLKTVRKNMQSEPETEHLEGLISSSSVSTMTSHYLINAGEWINKWMALCQKINLYPWLEIAIPKLKNYYHYWIHFGFQPLGSHVMDLPLPDRLPLVSSVVRLIEHAYSRQKRQNFTIYLPGRKELDWGN